MGRTWTTGLSYQFDNPNLEIGWRGRYVQNAGYAPTSRGSDVALNGRPRRLRCQRYLRQLETDRQRRLERQLLRQQCL